MAAVLLVILRKAEEIMLNFEQLNQKITAAAAVIPNLQGDITNLKGEGEALRAQVGAQQGEIATLQAQVIALQEQADPEAQSKIDAAAQRVDTEVLTPLAALDAQTPPIPDPGPPAG